MSPEDHTDQYTDYQREVLYCKFFNKTLSIKMIIRKHHLHIVSVYLVWGLLVYGSKCVHCLMMATPTTKSSTQQCS